MNDIYEQAVNILARGILETVEQKVKELPCTQCFPTAVRSVRPDGTCTVIGRDGEERRAENVTGRELSPGQSVWAMIPGGRLSHLQIYGIREKVSRSRSPF